MQEHFCEEEKGDVFGEECAYVCLLEEEDAWGECGRAVKTERKR